MSAVSALYFDGRQARAHSVRLAALDGDRLAIDGAEVQRVEAKSAIRVTPRLAGVHRTLFLADGAQVQVQDCALLDAWFPRRNRLESFVERLERKAAAVAAALLVVIGGGFGFFYIGVPLLAQHIANAVPAAVERRMGEETLALIRRLDARASALSAERQAALQEKFRGFVAGLPDAADYQLHFVAGLGANAFALPGGIVVVTDELVQVLDGDEQFLAVIAHEIGHEVHRHALREVLQASSVAIVASFFTGDVASASAAVVSIPAFLLNQHYSRDFETEADDYAFEQLAAHDISPARFADALLRVYQATHERAGEEHEYLATHPATRVRLERAHAAAQAHGMR